MNLSRRRLKRLICRLMSALFLLAALTTCGVKGPPRPPKAKTDNAAQKPDGGLPADR